MSSESVEDGAVVVEADVSALVVPAAGVVLLLVVPVVVLVDPLVVAGAGSPVAFVAGDMFGPLCVAAWALASLEVD